MKLQTDAEVWVENCMIHDGELAVRKITELRDCVTNEQFLREGKNQRLPYWLLWQSWPIV